MEASIREQLDQAAALRSKAPASGVEPGSGPDPVADCAISTWVWLGRVFARTRPCFWQGRNRWLGGTAFPDLFTVHTSVITIGAGASENPSLAAPITESQQHTRTQLASRSVQRLRGLLRSTATLAPAVAARGWEEALPKEGGGDLVSGAVPYERLPELVAEMRALLAEQSAPYERTEEWVELVIAAALCAERAGAHLVEGDGIHLRGLPLAPHRLI